jgi:hypothetical protein
MMGNSRLAVGGWRLAVGGWSRKCGSGWRFLKNTSFVVFVDVFNKIICSPYFFTINDQRLTVNGQLYSISSNHLHEKILLPDFSSRPFQSCILLGVLYA